MFVKSKRYLVKDFRFAQTCVTQKSHVPLLKLKRRNLCSKTGDVIPKQCSS